MLGQTSASIFRVLSSSQLLLRQKKKKVARATSGGWQRLRHDSDSSDDDDIWIYLSYTSYIYTCLYTDKFINSWWVWCFLFIVYMYIYICQRRLGQTSPSIFRVMSSTCSARRKIKVAGTTSGGWQRLRHDGDSSDDDLRWYMHIIKF